MNFIKNRKIQKVFILCGLILVFFVIVNLKKVIVYHQVVLPIWPDYHKEFQLDQIRINERAKLIEIFFEWEETFAEEQLEVAECTYRKLVERIFEKNSEYSDYTFEIMFIKVSQEPYLHIGNITKGLNEIEVTPTIYLPIGIIAKAFPETAYLTIGRITDEVIAELEAFKRLKEVHGLWGYTEDKEKLFKGKYPEIVLE